MVKQQKAAIDRIFHALADPTRRGILALVSEADRPASDLAASFRISFPAVSKHLRVLEDAGLIGREIDGRVHRFHLEAEGMRQAHDWISEYETFWRSSLDRLDTFLTPNEEKQT